MLNNPSHMYRLYDELGIVNRQLHYVTFYKQKIALCLQCYNTRSFQ